MVLAGGASAQSPEFESSIQVLDLREAEQERLKRMLRGVPQAYVDKVMARDELRAIGEEEGVPIDTRGRRSWYGETRLHAARHRNDAFRSAPTELGQRLAYRHETLNWGEFGIDADLRSAGGDPAFGPTSPAAHQRSSRMAARHLGFPLTPGVFTDASVGDVASDVTSALARTYRFSLGARPVRGVSARAFGEGFDVRGGYGLRGDLGGGPYPGFERLPGSLAWLGASRRMAGGAVIGLQIDRAAGIPLWDGAASAATGLQDVDSLAATVGYGSTSLVEGSRRGRVVYVRSSASGGVTPRTAQGWFAEGGLVRDGTRHEFGAYRTARNLRFGDAVLPAGEAGVYWRADRHRLRSGLGLGVQVADTEADALAGGGTMRQVSVQGNGEYRIGRYASIGGTATVERRRPRGNAPAALSDAGARSLYASAYWQIATPPAGRTRIRLTLRRSELLVTDALPATGEELELEHDWIRGRQETLRPELVTSIGIARDRSQAIATRQPTAGLSLRWWPDPDWSVSGYLRYTARNNNLSTSRGLAGTLQSEKVLRNGWRVGGALSLNQAVVDVSIAGSVPRITRSDDKIVSVYLRWEGSAGSTAQGVGVPTGSAGGGALEGVVFLDENRDGTQQPQEATVAGVEVLLDGRFPTTTDRSGRFSFPLVTTGRHTVGVRLESAPLPWGVGDGDPWSADVPLRGSATVRIPLVRTRP